MHIWLMIILMGIVTYAIRLSMILFLGPGKVPPLVRRGLKYVPVAVLSALILPAIVLSGGQVDLSWGNARWLAGIIAAAVAWRTRNVLLTIGTGMAALWILQAAFT
ncbi:MAG: AzlD domain-containing protein [Deinococcus sp.]|nr:AzlD domain-containing protein [Deinococcus sp.]